MTEKEGQPDLRKLSQMNPEHEVESAIGQMSQMEVSEKGTTPKQKFLLTFRNLRNAKQQTQEAAVSL